MANQTPDGIIEVVGASVANKGMMLGAATGVVGWLSQVNWVGMAGVVVAVLGLVISTYFQVRRDRREHTESIARIEAIREQRQR
jgi:hypothetical protein